MVQIAGPHPVAMANCDKATRGLMPDINLQSACSPADKGYEQARLDALKSYDILDTPVEPLFDELVEVAAEICDAPMAVINFIADGRQWFKAEKGIGTREMPLDVSICRHAILQPGLFVVPDLSADPRFEKNPLVTQAGGLRFYAGALLETEDGLPLGTVCVLDTKPRPQGLADRQGRVLQSLARHVMSELTLRRTLAERNREIADNRASIAALDTLIATRAEVEASSDDFQRLLDSIVIGALEAVPAADGATVELADGADMVYRAVAGASEPHRGLRIPAEGSLAGRCVAESRPLVADDTEVDPRVNLVSCRLVGARALLTVPLYRRGEAIGVLKLQSARTGAFGTREVTLAQLFTGLLAAGFADAAEAEANIALRQSEAMFRERLNAIPQMVWSTLPDGFHDFYNDRWYEFTGVPHGTTDGEGWSDMFHPEDQDRAWSLWRESLDTGEPYQIEYRLRHRSGQYRWVLGRALAIRGEDNAIVRWMGTCTDIDKLKRTADELGRASALLRLIGDSSPDLIYAKDRDSRLLYANSAAQKVIGLPMEEIVGRCDLDWAVDAGEAQEIMANDRRVVERGETLDLDETFTDPSGRTRYFRSVKAPLRSPAGAIVGVVGVTSDMTARREAEERERLLAREVDHRSKNLLAVVQSVVQLARAEDTASFKQAVIGRIQALGRAHSLLAASRWEGVELRTLIEEELAPFTGRERKNFSIEGPSLLLKPEVAQAMAMVVHELATNAAKYGALSAPGGTVALNWALDGLGKEQRLRLRWVERGGPEVQAPARDGFGSTVIRSSISTLR